MICVYSFPYPTLALRNIPRPFRRRRSPRSFSLYALSFGSAVWGFAGGRLAAIAMKEACYETIRRACDLNEPFGKTHGSDCGYQRVAKKKPNLPPPQKKNFSAGWVRKGKGKSLPITGHEGPEGG